MASSSRSPVAPQTRATSFQARPAAPLPPSRPVTGRITKVIRSRSCGFIRTPDGQDVFFHMADLVETSFDELDERMVLRFNLVADAISGPRAVQVQLAKPAPSKPARRRRTR